MSKYRRIRYEDRWQIYALSKRGASQESIARILGVSQSAVSREMRRNRGQRGYRFKQAEATAAGCAKGSRAAWSFAWSSRSSDPADQVAVSNVANEQVEAIGKLVEMAVSQAMSWQRVLCRELTG